MKQLETFDESVPCCKCGGTDIKYIYREEDDCKYLPESYQLKVSRGKYGSIEHIQCICNRCRYIWPVLPLDASIVNSKEEKPKTFGIIS